MSEKVGAVLVTGAGVGGIRASFDLAESGFKVYLVDRSPGIGGLLYQLEKWFPDNQCELCKLLPVFSRDDCSQYCLRRDLSHPNIELLPNSAVEKVEGEAGRFQVTVNTGSRRVIEERCTACGLCAQVCPVEIPDEFDRGLQNRKAIFVRNPQAVPNVFTIDSDNCTKCMKCVEVCPTNAIDLELTDEVRQLEVGAIIASTGADEITAPEMGQYGLGRYTNVMTNIQAERLLSSVGPTGGRLLRPSDNKQPDKVAILQCVGSRDMNRNYCSEVCCMYALKEGIIIKEKYPNADVTIYYMDMRAFGKDYYRYHLMAKDMGVNFVRCRVSRILENPKTKNLLLRARSEDGKSIDSEVDMAILSIAQCPSPYIPELSGVLGIDTNRWGFIQHNPYNLVKTSREGVYVCGSITGPSDISETVIHASAAACEASALLTESRKELVDKKAEENVFSTNGDEPRTAVFICRCGEEIPQVIDLEKVVESVQNLPGVVQVEEVDFLCLPENLDKVKQSIGKSQANRVIMAACAPYHYHQLFNKVLKESGISSSLWQLVNLREQVAWVHKEDKEAATRKAEQLISAAAELLRTQKALLLSYTRVNKQALVIGGGISGLSASLCLAEQGFTVNLVEKTGELGGHTRDTYYLPDDKDPQSFLNDIIKKVRDNDKIKLYLESEVTGISGRAGNFRSIIKTVEDENVIEHGAVIIATGANRYQPTEYLYEQSEQIITQQELQKRLYEDELGKPATVVMIQCVGSRNDEHPYCNRVCCTEAIINAIKIKESSPETDVFILNRDVMTYGLKEELYTRAREAGVLFLRFEPDTEPEISVKDNKVAIKTDDPVLSGKLEIEADLLVLSTGFVAGENKPLADMLSLDINQDGFYREMDIKFRPVDSVIDGVYICGLASAPRYLDEEIVQAEAAAQRAANLLSRDRLESGHVVSEVIARKCSGCGLCVDDCPFNARWMDEDRKIAVVEEAFCQGCGACVALCPNGAAKLRGMQDKQVLSIIDMVL